MILLALSKRQGLWILRVENPHVKGDKRHVHIRRASGGGGEFSWNENGSRRHPTKFPKGEFGIESARDLAAEALGVDRHILRLISVVDGLADITIVDDQDNELTISTRNVVLFETHNWIAIVHGNENDG